MFIKNKYFMFCTSKFRDFNGALHKMFGITIFKYHIRVDVYK